MTAAALPFGAPVLPHLTARLEALEAENERLLDLAERQAAEQGRLCTTLAQQAGILEALVAHLTGAKPAPPAQPAERQPCRDELAARRQRRMQGGAR